MCELALFSPDDGEIKDQVSYLKGMFSYNNDGLGIVAIYREGDSMNYSWYKATEPRWKRVVQFLYDNDDAWRIAAHARLATAGGVGLDQAHPIEVIDDGIDFDLVMHNGVVSGARRLRRRLKNAGHKFKTEVDSEVIPFKHKFMPEDIEKVEPPAGMYGSLNYFLFSKDGILVRAARKYDLNEEDFKMGLASRENNICNTEDTSVGERWVIAGPDEVESKPCETRGFGTKRKGLGGSGNRSGTSGGEDSTTGGKWDKANRDGYYKKHGKSRKQAEKDWWNRRFGDGNDDDSDWNKKHEPCDCGMSVEGRCPDCNDVEVGEKTDSGEPPESDEIIDEIVENYEKGLEYIFGKYRSGDEASEKDWAVHGRNN
jgi:hypothetical protein